MKKLLALVASEDIEEAEVINITSQIELYGISSDRFDIKSKEDLTNALYNGSKYDYIYLATHGCDTTFGNVSDSLVVTWIEFAAMICKSECNKDGTIFLHSCCRGGLNQVAWKMFICCNQIEFVCGPRNNISPLDLITAFNLFLFHVEVRKLDPVVAADKVRLAIDVRLVCYDRLDTEVEPAYLNHCKLIEKEVEEAFRS
jgi:hypothetical protein